MSADPGYANAVVVAYAGGVRWRVNAAAVAAFGDRVEGFLDVGAIADPAVVDRLADQWLAAHAGPRTSTVLEVEPSGAGDVPGTDFGVRQTVTTAGDTVECVGLTFSWDSGREDRMVSVPEFSTRLDAASADQARALERMIAQAGGTSAASAAPIDLGTDIRSGKVSEISVTPWSWDSDLSAVPAGGWQKFQVETPLRIFRWHVECDPTGSTGTTQIRLNILSGGTVTFNGLLDLVLAAGVGSATVAVWAYHRAYKDDFIFPSLVSNGGHKNGSIKVFASEIV